MKNRTRPGQAAGARLKLSKKLSLRASAHTGVAIRSPKQSDFILMFGKTAALKVRIPTVASLPRNDKELFDTHERPGQ